LIAALRGNRIAAAALDVFDIEPLPADHPFRILPNARLTPHIGYGALDTYRVMYAQTAENVRAWVEGAPIREI